MDAARIAYLRQELADECIDMFELQEIQNAFDELDPATLRDLPENAMASDMLDELEDALGPHHPMATLTVEDFITEDELDFAEETLGEGASKDDILELATERAHTYFEEYVSELDDRFPTMVSVENCPDCGEPSHYDYSIEAYRHNSPTAPECFLKHTPGSMSYTIR